MPDAARSPTLIDEKYELVRELGRGEAGTVYEATNLVIGKRVALKLLSRVSPEALGSVIREARAAARIGHPNVIDILDTGVDRQGRAYVVMELLRGETLLEIMEARGPLPAPYACELVLQVLGAAAAAHKAGVVHRDLKPANVFVTHPSPQEPVVKVLDFGLAETGDHLNPGAGTPAYMPPEQALGLDLDGRADIFSASVILYELISGRLPYKAATVEQQFVATYAGRFVPLSDIMPSIPVELADAIERGLAGSRDARYQNAEEMIERIQPFASSAALKRSGHSLAPIPLVQRRKRQRFPTISAGPLAQALYRATRHV
jgi:eukaryotic-like serine/threonine-protein kinase